MVWCFARVLLPSASGRQRHNVLGAYDPIRHEAITVTNDTYINQGVFCEFFDKIAAAYAGAGHPITLVLDTNSRRFRRCPLPKMPVGCRQGRRTGHRTPLSATLFT
jgi:hypothetical protein